VAKNWGNNFMNVIIQGQISILLFYLQYHYPTAESNKLSHTTWRVTVVLLVSVREAYNNYRP
jgi:hypothetical protein